MNLCTLMAWQGCHSKLAPPWCKSIAIQPAWQMSHAGNGLAAHTIAADRLETALLSQILLTHFSTNLLQKKLNVLIKTIQMYMHILLSK